MRKLGLLGLGNYTTVHYMEQLNSRFLNKKGGYSTCPFLLLNANFDTINPYLPNQFDCLEPVLLGYLKEIASLGIQQLLIPNITLHQTLDRLLEQHSFSFQVLHPIALAAKALQNQAINQVVVFATAYTMQSSYIPDFLEKYHIQTIPPTDQQIQLSDTIRKEIYENGINTAINEKWKELIATANKNTAILIACTELSLLPQLATNTFDLVDLQLQAAIELF